ncbi:MAG TPA: DNA methyltransferase [Anaerolineae bacterium]|nr:DNA methyltransferase [Anaerolineae bacterium]
MTILNAQTNSGASVPVKYRRDHHQRRNLCFDEQSFQHPAKTNLNWLGRLLHLYTETHQIVLDPFGGSGSILLATYTGRQVITGDVEAHLAQLLNQNALRIRSKSLFSAPAQVARWDAGHLPLADNSIPVIITSPPYFDTFSTWNAKSGNQLTHNPGPTGSCYGFDPRQIANVHVYETYLRIMAQVYRECRRVLCPSGTLLLILGDKIHKGRVVPITADTETLCTAMGFTLTGRKLRYTIPSHYRNITAQQHGTDYPTVNQETALIFQNANDRLPPARHISIIQAPSPESAPGRQLFDKQLYWAHHHCRQTLILNGPGAATPYHVADHVLNPVWRDVTAKARRRAEWAFEVVRQLISTGEIHAGDVIHLHVSHTYAPYLQRRLNTVGCHVEIPTEHFNFGQKLKWFTDQTKGDRP